MSEVIDGSVQYASVKAKPRLKNGTNIKAKPKAAVSLAQPRWDQGASGPANRVGLVIESRGTVDMDTGEVVNPNGVKGARRVDMLETYHSRGWISDRGYTAGEALRDAWGDTQRSKGADLSEERVDRTAKPGAAMDIKIDRMSRLVDISKHIAKGDAAIIWAVVGEGRALSHLKEYRNASHAKGKAHLRAALDRLADRMDA